MSHNHITADSDVRFVLDPITRKLSTDSGRKTLAQGDHRSEIFTFDLPRYIEGHDMSLCTSAQIHFTNTEGKQPKRTSQDLWEATDFELSGDAVTFTWKIENTATKYVGSLAFSIKLQCISVDEAAGYVIDYEYNSLEYTKISVAAAQNNIEETVEESTSLLSSFKEQALSEVEDRIAEAEKEAAESLADKMQDYVDAAEEAAKRAETIVDLTIDAELNKNSENPIQNNSC